MVHLDSAPRVPAAEAAAEAAADAAPRVPDTRAAAPHVYNLPHVTPRLRSYSAADNFLESSAAAVGTFAGTAIAAGLAALLGQRNDDNVLSLSAGAGSVIGTTSHGFLMGKPICKTLENGIVGFPGAMAGYALGNHINDEYVRYWIGNTGPKQGSTDFYGALLNGAFAGLCAGTTVGVKNLLRGVGACQPPHSC